MRSYVLWCMSFDPHTRWHPIRSHESHSDALTDRNDMTAATWKHRTRLKYAVLPAGERPLESASA